MRGKHRYISGSQRIMSYPITIDGRTYSVTTIYVGNTQASLPNSREIHGKLHFKHLRLDREFTIDAWFRVESEPPFNAHKTIALNDGEMNARVILFVTGNGDRTLYTYIQRKFDPPHQEAFPGGEWEITPRVFGENESDKACTRIHVNLGQKGGLSRGIVE